MAGRKFGLYFAWNRPREINASLDVLDNRFPTLFEFRRLLWPHFEQLRQSSPQSVQGFLDFVVLPDFERFTQRIKEATGNDVVVLQRGVDGAANEIDSDVIKDIDTLIVISLDHQRTAQATSPAELEAIQSFLSRENSCLIVCPHHDIGVQEQLIAQEVEYRHHGDITIPPQQRFSGFARSILGGLGFAIENQFGLNPASAGDGSPAPLARASDLDDLQLLQGVTTFNLHPHLPHLYVPKGLSNKVDILARQPINLKAPSHPFVEAGNTFFNALLRFRSEKIAGTMLACDATLWSSAFGGLGSLEKFWANLAGMRL